MRLSSAAVGTTMTEGQQRSTSDRAWRRGPLDPLLPDAAVHVWRADLSTASGEVLESLSADEQARAARLASRHKARLWGRSRGVLRALLGRYLEIDPQVLRFAIGEHGKPTLLDNPGTSSASQPTSRTAEPLFFSLSHSGEWAIYAFTKMAPVGIDIEVTRRSIDEVAVAKQAFGSAEALRLRALDPEAREGEFLRSWARGEAELKRLGTRMSGNGLRRALAEPWIEELDVGPRAAAAVAVGGPWRELCCWDYC